MLTQIDKLKSLKDEIAQQQVPRHVFLIRREALNDLDRAISRLTTTYNLSILLTNEKQEL